jgi:hypothetical protein
VFAKVPIGHVGHASDSDLCPVCDKSVTIVEFGHEVHLVFPVVLLYVPTGHGMQNSMDFPPDLLLYVPLGHATHEEFVLLFDNSSKLS